MKRIVATITALCLMLGFAAFAGEAARGGTLVVYFSCTGTTKGVAEKLANVTGADLYEIVPAEPYTDADLNYSDRNTRATWEQEHPEQRPEIEGLKPVRTAEPTPEQKTADGQIEDLSAAPLVEDIDLAAGNPCRVIRQITEADRIRCASPEGEG